MSQELKITLTDEGQISVSGPIHNKVLSYGMLAAAADAIREYGTEHQSRIQPVMVIPKLPGS